MNHAATIWKYDIAPGDVVSLSMPEGARVLSVHTQHGAPKLWALVDPEAPKETRRFRIYGTGHTVDIREHGELRFVGTFLVHADNLVFHLFEVVG